MAFIRKSDGDNLFAAEVNEFQIGIENSEGHISRIDNPHSVTKDQVGLANVDNTSDADKPVSTAQATAIALKADTTALTAHTGNTSNPHGVTKAQVGLGSVDNTSDLSKPISTATQTALNAKANTTHTHAAANITDFDTEVSNNTDVAANTSARHTHSNKTVLDGTTASYTTAEKTKLADIEAGATTVTTARVDAAGAVMVADTATTGMGFVINETTMASNSSTKVPTQSSVKAYVDTGLGTKANTSHTHTVSQVTNLQAELDAKSPVIHTHNTSDVTGLDTALAGKSAVGHTHGIADINATGTRSTSTYLRGDGTFATPPNTTYSAISLAEAEAGTATTSRVINASTLKSAIIYHSPPTDISGKSDIGHTHVISDVTNLQNELNNKSSVGHTHSFAAVNHTHGMADITDLSAMSLTEAQTATATTSRLLTAATLKDAIVYHSPPPDLSTLNSHVSDTSNPHNVTAAQVGAALSSHLHDDRYSLLGHTHAYAASSHTHDDRYYTETETNNLLAGKAASSHTHNYAAASHSHGLEVPVAGYGEIGSQQVNIADGASYTHGTVTVSSDAGPMAFYVVIAMSAYGDLGYTGTFYIRVTFDGTVYESGLFQADQGVDAGAVYTFAGNTTVSKTSRTMTIQTRCSTGIYTVRNTSWSYLMVPRTANTV